MMRIFTLTLFICFCLSVLSQSTDNDTAYVAGKVFVKFKNDLNLEELKSMREEASLEQFLRLDNTEFRITNYEWPFKEEWRALSHVVRLDVVGNEEEFCRYVEGLPNVIYAERIPERKFNKTPNDLHPSQWYLPKINAEQAWDIATGRSSVTVAVIDNSVDLDHEDLKNVLWTNTGEIANNNVDDDGNGYIDDVHGYDVGMNDGDPSPPAGASPSYFFHGTHCAGIAAAHTDNDTGIASIGYGINIISIKASNDINDKVLVPGAGYDGIIYAMEVGADIITMSWGGAGFAQTEQALINQAYQQGIVCVASAGNDSIDIPNYPAAYDNVLAVGATNPSDKKANFSNFGDWVDVMAPGTSIYSTVPGSSVKYDYFGGTSMSTPMVAGLAGLIKSVDTNATVNEIRACILSTADDIYSQNPAFLGQLGSGRINAYEALKCKAWVVAAFESDKQQVCPGNNIQFTDQTKNNPTSWKWYFPGSLQDSSTQQHPVIKYPFAGTYDVTLIVSNGVSSDTIVKEDYISVGFPQATLSGNHDVLPGYPVNLRVDFTGNPPWEITYSDGSTFTTISNITSNPFYFPVTVYDTTTFDLVFMKDNGCNGIAQGQAQVNVIELPDCYRDSLKLRVREYNNENENNIHGILSCNDGGILMYGNVKESANANNDFLLVKVDSNDQIEWSRHIGNGKDQLSKPLSVYNTSDGGFLIGGSENRNGSSALLVKLDDQGNIEWHDVISHDGATLIRYVLEANDHYYVGGTTNSDMNSSDAIFGKYDKNGNVIYFKILGGATNDHVNGMTSDPDSNIVAVGNTQSFGQNNRNGLLVNLNAQGQIEWSEVYSAGRIVQLRSIISIDEGYFVTARTGNFSGDYDVLIMKLTHEGEVLWSKIYDGGNDDFPVHMEAANTGGYYVSGYTNSFDGNRMRSFLMQIDDGGNILWVNAYGFGSAMSSNNWAPASVKHSDNSFKMSFNTDDGIYLFTLNPCGESACFVTDIKNSFEVSNYAVSNDRANLDMSEITNEPEVDVSSTDVPFSNTSFCDPTLVQCDVSADFSMDPNCPNDTTRFLDNSFDIADRVDITNWKWDFGDGTVVAEDSAPGHVYTQEGTYNVTLIAYGDTGSFCVDTVTKQVTISNELEVLPIPGDTICLGGEINMPAPVVNCGTPGYSYEWSPATGLSNPNTLTTKAKPTSSTEYTLTVTDQSGQKDSLFFYLHVDTLCCVSQARISVNDSIICVGDSITFVDSSSASSPANYEWSFMPSGQPNNFLGDSPPPVSFNQPGIWEARLILNDLCGSDTTYQKVYIYPKPVAAAGKDTTVCKGDSIAVGQSNLSTVSYSWTPNYKISDTNRGDPLVYPDRDTFYIMRAEDNSLGCVKYDTIQIKYDTLPEKPTLPRDLLYCEGESISINGEVENANSYSWSNGSSNASTEISDSGWVWLEVQNICGSKRDSAYINYGFAPKFELPSDTSLCPDDSLLLVANIDPDTSFFQWYDQSSDSSKIVADSGKYWLTATNECGISTDSIFVDSLPYPREAGLPSDTVFCANDVITLTAQAQYASHYSWNDGSMDDEITIEEGGEYWVESINRCGTVKDTIWVEEFLQPHADLPNDTFFCENDSLSVNLTGVSEYTSITWSNGSDDTSNTINTPGALEVTLENICGTSTDSMKISEIKLPVVQVPADTTICPGDTIKVRSERSYDNYTWSDGSQNSFIVTGKSGWIWLESTNECGARRDSMLLSFYNLPLVDAGKDSTIAKGTSADLDGEADGNLHWEIHDDDLIACDTCLATRTSALDTTTYFYLKTTDSMGCEAMDSVRINVKIICQDVMLPNAFTPNGDGLNDQFKPLSKTGNQELIELRIYSRWGELMYRTTEMSAGWDGTFRGKAQDPGVYTYVLRYECKDEEFVDKGNVTLIR